MCSVAHTWNSKQMKLAVCFSGQPRFLDGPQIQSIKHNLLDKYDCDVYCHTWWSPDLPVYETSFMGEVKARSDTIEMLQALFQPKKIHYEAPLQNLPPPSNMRSMYESIRRSYLLVDTSIHYDFIVRMRYDIFIDALPNVCSFNTTSLHCPFLYYPKNLFVNHCWFAPPLHAPKIFNLVAHIQDNDKRIEERVFTDALFTHTIPIQAYSRHVLSSTRFRIDRIFRGPSDSKSTSIIFISIVSVFALVVYLGKTPQQSSLPVP